MSSPGLRYFLFGISLLCSNGGKSSTITPSSDNDIVYNDMVKVLRENIDEDAIPNKDCLSGTIELELNEYGEQTVHVEIYEDRTVLQLR